MDYDRFMKGCGFFMHRRPNSRIIHILPWDTILCDMVYAKSIQIWRVVKGDEIPSTGMITHSTPKLRKMMRRNDAT